VKKKIQDLTLKETQDICKSQHECSRCPLHRAGCIIAPDYHMCAKLPREWDISKYRKEVEVSK